MAAGALTQGRRRDLPENSWSANDAPLPGDYGKMASGQWYGVVPVLDLLGSLAMHEVVEHEDDTITVSPSILMEHWNEQTWHGYLERGVWREV